MRTQMVKGNLYKKALGRHDQPHTEIDLERSGMLVERRWAEDLNWRNEKDDRGLQVFVIDEEATDEYYKQRKKMDEQKDAQSKFEELNKEDLASTLLKMAAGSTIKEEKEKPKRTRRTKAEIESEKKD